MFFFLISLSKSQEDRIHFIGTVTPAIVDTEADNGQYHYRLPYTDIVLVDVI